MKRIIALGLGLLVCLAACKKKETDDPTSTPGTTSTDDTLGRSITLSGVGDNSAGALLRYNPSDNSYKTIYTFSKDNSKYAAIYSELIEL